MPIDALDLGAARERVRVARSLATLPRLAQALGRGELSYAKVRALTRVATPETEEQLLGVGRAGTASHVERIVRGWRRVDRRAETREAALKHASRGLHVYQDEDGMVTVRGRLEPEVGALLVQALAAARETLYQKVGVSAETSTMARQQADALALLAETALHHGIDPGAPGERYQVVVSCRRPCPRRPRSARPVRPRGRRTRFRGNVPARGLRREPGGHATRTGRSCRGGRRTHPHDSPGVTARASPPGPWLRSSLRTGSPHPSLGPRRPDDALESRPPVSPSPPRRP